MNNLSMIETMQPNSAHNTTISIPKGVSLIEMLLVIALISVIFTVGASVLAFLMRVEMRGTARIQESLNLQRLSHQFREDAGAAQNVEIDPQNNKNTSVLKFNMEPDTSIIYSESNQGNTILRVKKQSNNIITRTEYRISEEAIHFEVEKLNQSLMVSMSFRILPEELYENQTVKKVSRLFRVESQVNRKHSVQNRIAKIN